MAKDRTITFPADAIGSVVDVLCDLDMNLPGDEAEELARDIVIDVTMAVDKLRAAEGGYRDLFLTLLDGATMSDTLRARVENALEEGNVRGRTKVTSPRKDRS